MEDKRQFGARACDAVRAIPAGRVASYGAVAAAAGRPGAARAVGRVLRGLSDDAGVPWWRVINARGEITIPRSGLAGPLQRALLVDEGVTFGDAGRVDMERHAWHFERDGGDGEEDEDGDGED